MGDRVSVARSVVKLLAYCRVELSYESVSVSSVNLAGFLYRLASGTGAGKAMHSYFKEKRLGLGMVVEYIAYYGIFCYFHFSYFLSCYFEQLYYIRNDGIVNRKTNLFTNLPRCLQLFC